MTFFKTTHPIRIAVCDDSVLINPAWLFSFVKEVKFAIASINCVMPRQKGIEVSFRSAASMNTFVNLVRPEHKVQISGHDSSKVVSVIGLLTNSPRRHY